MATKSKSSVRSGDKPRREGLVRRSALTSILRRSGAMRSKDLWFGAQDRYAVVIGDDVLGHIGDGIIP